MTITSTILFSALGLCIYGMHRNTKVCLFRNKINDLCYNWSVENTEKESAYRWCYDKLPCYDKMVFSFKPLKMEKWLTDEMIKKFNK